MYVNAVIWITICYQIPSSTIVQFKHKLGIKEYGKKNSVFTEKVAFIKFDTHKNKIYLINK